MSFRRLDSTHILSTLERLEQRIVERFPDAGLARVARDLGALGRECAEEARSLGTPNWPLRAVAAVLILIMLMAAGTAIWRLWPAGAAARSVAEFVQGIEAAINDAVFLGVAVWFLASVEGRIKRRIALKALHELRSVAHIVDMHQLTKDPERLMSPAADTTSSPSRVMSSTDLGRYLDYCSELLSLTSKIAALYVQDFDDSMVLQAVNEIESLTNGLSRKIWQKITILESASEPEPLRAAATLA
jgi:hypothetical protein